jgi:hypothetical protein
MSWGASPNFRISRRTLSYAACEQIYKDRAGNHRGYTHANIADTAPGRSNYWIEWRHERNPITNEVQQCYQLLMYRTYILTWFEDGTISTENYDSGITRSVLSAFGPVRVWSDTRLPFVDKDRFGSWRGDHYPYGNGLVIAPNGDVVTPLVDQKRRIKPELKAKRREMLALYRRNALPRMMLGEFGDVFAIQEEGSRKIGFGRRHSGWWGLSLGNSYAGEFFEAMCKKESIDMDRYVSRYNRDSIYTVPANSEDEAIVKSMNAIARAALSDSVWYEHHKIPYPAVNIHAL